MRQRLANGRRRVNNPPTLDIAVSHVWHWFQELDASRLVSGQSGIVPITFAEISAFSALTGERIAEWEVRAIRAADDAVIAAISDHMKKKSKR